MKAFEMRMCYWSSDVCSSDPACATPAPPVEVTRFHSAAVAGWAPGTRYVVDPRPLADPAGAASGIQPSLEWDSYRTAVERQLQLQGLVAAEGTATSTGPHRVRNGFERAARPAPGKRQEERGGGQRWDSTG